MLLELEKKRSPRALLLLRSPRHDEPRRAAGLSRAELTPMRFFLPVRNGESLTTDLDVGSTHVSLRAAAHIYVGRC